MRLPDGECWIWRVRAGNGRLLATSVEAYDRKGDARRAANRAVAMMRRPCHVMVAGNEVGVL